jgi:hypothetical protein
MGIKKGKDGRWETEEERKKANRLRGKRGESLRARDTLESGRRN